VVVVDDGVPVVNGVPVVTGVPVVDGAFVVDGMPAVVTEVVTTDVSVDGGNPVVIASVDGG
jgi:hypothetical protein